MARTREQIIELVRQMKLKTVDNGCTPGEAAKFAAKAAEWIEEYQIEQAELRKGSESTPTESEMCQDFLRTNKKVFNPGMTDVVNNLCIGMCCKCIMLHKNGEAVYGIVGDSIDTSYVCQMSIKLVPELQFMAKLEGREHGYEKAGLVRWTNQYLGGAAEEIRKRIETERRERSDLKVIQAQLDERSPDAPACTALSVITGLTVAVRKREATKQIFNQLYPDVKTSFSKSNYDHTARQRGREAGRRVGLHVGIEGN